MGFLGSSVGAIAPPGIKNFVKTQAKVAQETNNPILKAATKSSIATSFLGEEKKKDNLIGS